MTSFDPVKEIKTLRCSKKPKIGYFLAGIATGIAFGIYLWSLYSHLTTTFRQTNQVIPTRIYSDVTRITAAQPRSAIEMRLKSLGYTVHSPVHSPAQSPAYSNETSIQFSLHPVDYPTYLIPDNHPILDKKSPTVTLHFESKKASSLLQSIDLEGREIPDLYLEPELVATLSRSGDLKREIRTALKFEEIPASVWKAIIAIEDQHFLDHKGLDPRGIARAIWVNLKTLSLAQGGSTITQQLVKNLMVRRTKNIFHKVNEVFLSLLLEAKFEKEQILERYLNEVYLGQIGNLEIHGVAEGAEHFFGKKLSDLNLAETALMAGLIRGPGYYSPYRFKARALARQKLVLQKMVETGQIAEEEAEQALKIPLRLAPPQTVAIKAPFFTDYVKAELVRILQNKYQDKYQDKYNDKFKGGLGEQEITQAGFRVYTTLDATLNSEAQQALSNGITALEKRLKVGPEERLEGALAVVDHTNGYIRALIGGRNYSQSNFNRILNMKRQVGSTFKPIVYLTALQKGEDPKGIPYGPAYPVEDAPWTLVFDQGRQTWSPKNYEKKNLGWISFRTSLAQSVNTIAAKLGYQIGLDEVIKTARSLGIESQLPKLPSLFLGVAEMSPIELLRVYATLANRGVENELSVIHGITQSDGSSYARFIFHSKQLADPGPIDLLTDMLQSVFTEGTARGAQKMGFDRPAAGKTGTTNNHRDAWFAGYSSQLTTVVWVGMDQSSLTKPSKIHLTGSNSALPIWVSFMRKALSHEPSIPFVASPFIVDVPIDRHTGKGAESNCSPSQVVVEKYLRNHEPRDKSCETNWPAHSKPIINEGETASP